MNNDFIDVMYSENITNSNPWEIVFDGYFKSKVEEQMAKDGLSEEAVDSIFFNASRILNHCPQPGSNEEISETGIVIGKVQSGKTSNFISTIALAFDNGYDIAIVLGGNKLDLLNQNGIRIKEAFGTDADKLVVLSTKDNRSIINSDRIKEFIENGQKVIIVGLKHPKHITKIAEIFDNHFLSSKPVLIIDDEGDQAILNTKAYLNSMSSTYESVLNLKNKLKRHCLLSITATPQANILIDETYDKLSPDFGELVYPGDGYCGLQEFHGENGDKHICEIPSNEQDLLEGRGVPVSAFMALAMFFVGNAIRRSRGDNGTHAMLIHPSRKKFDHQTVVNKLQVILNSWKTHAKIRLGGDNDISYTQLRKWLLGAYQAFVNDGVKSVSFSELEPTILDVIRKCSPILQCNSAENASGDANLYKTNIFVGGDLVERGLTIKGLAITYLTRRARGKSNVDNTEQRARWFGYKKEYIDVCRVFLTKDIKEDFISILEHDEEMWASIERARDRGIPFKEMPRIFVLTRNAFLRLTRQNVARTTAYELAEWKPQKFLIIDQGMVERNLAAISEYREHNNSLIEERGNGMHTHAVLKNKHYSDVYAKLLSKLEYRADEVLNKHYFDQLKEALEQARIDPLVDIFWVRDRNGSTRTVKEDRSIQQLFQGRNPNVSSPTYYAGDRSLPNEEPDHIQIQIHRVKPKNIEGIDFYSPVLAIYIPEWCSQRLSNLVVRNNG